MKKGNTNGRLLLVCAMVVAFAAVTEAAEEKSSPANCMPQCMSICPKDSSRPCEEKCVDICNVLTVVHEVGMKGAAGGHDQKQGTHHHKHAKTAHHGKQTDGQTAEGDSEHAICKSTCMLTCATMRTKRPTMNCDRECHAYCNDAIKYRTHVGANPKSKN